MDFEKYLLDEIKRHPSVQPQDIVKLCYQSAYGAEHLLGDLSAAEKYFEKEYAVTVAEDKELYEPISHNICRVNLGAWKRLGLPPGWLFKIFAASSSVRSGDKDKLLSCLRTAEEALSKASVSFSPEDWQTYLCEYKKAGMPSVHHSQQYREKERPAYRIADRQYIRLLPILEKAAKELREDKLCVIAIDGRAASGKSTAAAQLKTVLEADIIQMDDFFLPAELRTQERFDTPGGNVHHERFIREVLPHISLPKSFSYRIFDCGKMDYNGECAVESTGFRIVEGSYSCHPLFGKYADITVFSDIAPDEQLRRIRLRNGEDMTEMFRDKWIPLEEKYFEYFSIAEKADIRI